MSKHEETTIADILQEIEAHFVKNIESAIDICVEMLQTKPEKRDGLTYAVRRALEKPTRDYILVKVMAALNAPDTLIRDMPLLKEWVEAIITKQDSSLTWGRSSTIYDIAWALACDPISKKQPIEALADNLKRRIPCILREIERDIADLAERWEKFKVSAKAFMQAMNKEAANETD